jgi:chromosome segregation ATPase
MSAATLSLDCESIRGAFRQWRAEQEPLEAQLAESLAALSAYQSHLDAWQQQLVRERDELRSAREQLDRDRSAPAGDQERCDELSKQLSEARDKIAALTSMLLTRTEELRASDMRRSEVASELELARAREKDLATKLEELRQSREAERAQWAKELENARNQPECRLENSEPAKPAAPPPKNVSRSEAKSVKPSADNPVLSSIMEQFGKLRQQRTQDRPTFKKAR